MLADEVVWGIGLGSTEYSVHAMQGHPNKEPSTVFRASFGITTPRQPASRRNKPELQHSNANFVTFHVCGKIVVPSI